MEEKISIQKENVLNAYKQATKEQKALLENMFGKDVFQPKDIMERVKTFEDACEVLGEDNQYVKAYREWMRIYYAECKDVTAYLKLRIICAALNDGWKHKFTEDEKRWYPWFRLWTEEELENKSEDWKTENKLCVLGGSSDHGAFFGLTCEYTSDVASLANADPSVLLSVKQEKLAAYFGKQFIDIWADYLFG